MGRYYKTPEELSSHALSSGHRPETKEADEICACGTGFDWSCTAHEHKNEPKPFPWGSAILVVLFIALLIFDTLYGGFNPFLFPGACG